MILREKVNKPRKKHTWRKPKKNNNKVIISLFPNEVITMPDRVYETHITRPNKTQTAQTHCLRTISNGTYRNGVRCDKTYWHCMRWDKPSTNNASQVHTIFARSHWGTQNTKKANTKRKPRMTRMAWLFSDHTGDFLTLDIIKNALPLWKHAYSNILKKLQP